MSRLPESKLPEEEPATLMNWLQLFGFLISVMVIAYLVVSVFSFIFRPSGGGP
jgi:hypothetical protein